MCPSNSRGLFASAALLALLFTVERSGKKFPFGPWDGPESRPV
jgi:hypothetical protein